MSESHLNGILPRRRQGGERGARPRNARARPARPRAAQFTAEVPSTTGAGKTSTKTRRPTRRAAGRDPGAARTRTPRRAAAARHETERTFRRSWPAGGRRVAGGGRRNAPAGGRAGRRGARAAQGGQAGRRRSALLRRRAQAEYHPAAGKVRVRMVKINCIENVASWDARSAKIRCQEKEKMPAGMDRSDAVTNGVAGCYKTNEPAWIAASSLEGNRRVSDRGRRRGAMHRSTQRTQAPVRAFRQTGRRRRGGDRHTCIKKRDHRVRRGCRCQPVSR